MVWFSGVLYYFLVICSFVCRGPTYGYRGKVVLAFEENGSSKIGVRFDRSIPEGNDLGGLCEEDHGFFCAGGSLYSLFFCIQVYALFGSDLPRYSLSLSFKQ